VCVCVCVCWRRARCGRSDSPRRWPPTQLREFKHVGLWVFGGLVVDCVLVCCVCRAGCDELQFHFFGNSRTQSVLSVAALRHPPNRDPTHLPSCLRAWCEPQCGDKGVLVVLAKETPPRCSSGPNLAWFFSSWPHGEPYPGPPSPVWLPLTGCCGVKSL
jgi:hypothetical protein